MSGKEWKHMLDERQLDEILSRPSEELISDLEKLDGDIMVLGAGGKVGPTVCVMLQRAVTRCAKPRKVYALILFEVKFECGIVLKKNLVPKD